ncbi:MAG: dynamin family protein [Polyangia bacterium]
MDLFEDRFPVQRQRLVEWLKGLAALGREVGDEEAPRTIEMLLGGLSEPFLLVVLGEIKTGKSRFLNALLGVPGLCAEDAEAHTAAVEKLDYGAEPTERWISAQLKQRTAPVPLLKRLSIVDTPGTNSMVPEHEVITRQFLPRADLCIFVLLAKKPPSGSEWRLLDLMQHEWRKKLLVVLQQKDLLADEPENLQKVVKRVQSDLAARGLADAPVFCTSAKWEERAQPEERARSGFPELRSFIHDTVTGPDVQRLKLQAAQRSAERELLRLQQTVAALAKEFQEDQAVVGRINETLASSQRRGQEEIKNMVSRIVENYRGLADKLQLELEQGLGVGALLSRSFRGIWNKEQGVDHWLKKELKERFQEKVRGLVDEIAERRARSFVDDLRGLLDSLQVQMQQLSGARPDRSELGWDRERDAVLETVRKNLAALQQGDSFRRLLSEDPGNLVPMAGAGGALAAVGTAIVVATNVAVFDVTGGLLAAMGLAMAGGYLALKRPRIRREFRDSLQASEKRFSEQLQSQLLASLDHIHDKIRSGFSDFYQLLTEREARLSRQRSALAELEKTRLALLGELTQP